ncbi:MAG: hypothetical protein V1835_04635 [Candidatus Micrarchaeota archaeon]
MSDEFREELLNISEKLGKYNSAMQESLNILSDEFLLLRDELSTLNQNLEKTKDIDVKLEQFGKTVDVLQGLQDKLKVVEKVAESMAIANTLAGKIDTLAQRIEGSKEKMDEAVTPLSKKMDMLYSKFDETLSPLNRKMDTLSEAFKEELKESADALKGEEQLKSLALSIQDELNKMQKGFDEQNNSIRGIGTSVAYLSSSEGEMKKSLDGLLKLYEQDRERLAAEKTRLEADSKKHGAEVKSERLEEIIALLKVQSEQLQKQEAAIESVKAGKSQAGPPQHEELLKELKKQSDSVTKLQQQIDSLKSSMPGGNFEEVIKHADLINQATNSKLDSIMEINGAYGKSVSGNNERAAQLPSLMQNVSAALDALVSEMKKSQQAYKSLENSIEKLGARQIAASPDHLEKLETITENIRGLHSKIDSTPQAYETQLKAVVEELRKFEQIEQQRLAEKPQLQIEEQLKLVVEELKKSSAGTSARPNAEMPQYEKQLQLVIEELRKFEELEKQRLAAPQQPQMVSTPGTDASAKLDAQLISIKKELLGVSQNVETLKNVLVQGTDITAEVDFAPVMVKIDQMQTQITDMLRSSPQAAQPQVQLSGTKLLDQREIFEEIAQNLRVFESFELSDRAKIVVDRVQMLIKRGLTLYSS